jgi:UDP-N-acetylmuramoyl-tripeptide--D-alanyl-D-alanine ligase
MTRPFPLTAAAAAAACGGTVASGDPHRTLPRFSTDTRTLREGDAFLALVGPTFNGHTFVRQAVNGGAAAVVVHEADCVGAVADAGAVAILVPDTLQALQALAHHVRRVSGARVVAITGSAGKTTTKETTATLLASKFATLRNRGNLNNHIGLPLSLLELQAGAEVAVVELGMNHPGEISRLVAIAEPDVRLWTNVGTAHLAHFGTMDAIASAKAEILEGATPDTVFVANADDPRVMARVSAFPGRTITFGLDAPAAVRAESIRDRGIEGQDVSVRTAAGTLDLTLHLPGRGHLANVLASIAVAREFGVDLQAIPALVAQVSAGSHRGQVLRLARGVRVFDDCYNSSPGALLRALDVVGATAVRGRKIAVLGEMLELGEQSERLHRECGRAAVAAGVARVLTVGGAPALALGEAAREAGLPADAVLHTESSAVAADRIGPWVGDGDLVLVKGSRGIGLERVVTRLEAEGV